MTIFPYMTVWSLGTSDLRMKKLYSVSFRRRSPTPCEGLTSSLANEVFNVSLYGPFIGVLYSCATLVSELMTEFSTWGLTGFRMV